LFSQHYRKRDLLLKIFTMKKDLQRFRHVVVPVRDILTSLTRGDMHILRQEDMPYYRDVYDHAVRVIDQMDAARDITASALDLQFSLASNQQSEITKQLTIIATIFLPLTYLTGFFGQNFAFLTESVKSPEAFFAFGLGGEALAFSVLLLYFRYKRWL
jgi:magnesium transporter